MSGGMRCKDLDVILASAVEPTSCPTIDNDHDIESITWLRLQEGFSMESIFRLIKLVCCTVLPIRLLSTNPILLSPPVCSVTVSQPIVIIISSATVLGCTRRL